MAKLKTLNIKGITSELFTDHRSHKAALQVIHICNRLIDRVNKGDIVFHYENLIRPAFELRWEEGKFKGLYLKDFEGAWVQIVGDNTDEDGRIHCRMYDMREYFKLWRVAKITDVARVMDLV